MKHITTLIDAPDELSRAGVFGVLAGARYKPITIKGGWEAVIASGKAIPEIVILVLNCTPKNTDGIIRKIEAIAKDAKVIILADRCEADLVACALCAGGSAFLPLYVGRDILIQTLTLAVEEKIVMPSQLLRDVFAYGGLAEPKRAEGEAVTAPERPRRLSLRQIDILRRLVRGDSNKEISRQLGISEMKVKVHVRAILRKAGVHNRTQAAIWGRDHIPDVLSGGPDVISNASSQRLLSKNEYSVSA
jgi:two-component system nitrate/nitrite response regulator NarL